MRTRLEFYRADRISELIAALNSEHVPAEGALVNIRKKTWRVTRITYAVDNADSARSARLRACVELEAQWQ